ncbi:hypothetical protein, conserved [Leishmania tarentolae]|uniref:PDZ domain-containing protein n=1 Tax=Leishmania tarentolae TaxID=5689 RepID=A0A640KFQ8_LEITA|nr:hypothetical protein, conserved [Leishmania tarentolae]
MSVQTHLPFDMTSAIQLMPHSERDGSESSVSHPHRVGETLASELSTLCRLRNFYEQHTFDTQGPYADLFAVLLSSCKHVIDINVELVYHIKAQEDQQQRQQVACDALSSEASQLRADIKHLRASLAPLSARGASGEAAVIKCEHDGARLGSDSAASLRASPHKETATAECCQHISQGTPAASLALQRCKGGASPPSTAAGLERSSLSTALTSRVGRVSPAHATVTFAPTEAPMPPISSSTHSSPSEHARRDACTGGIQHRPSAAAVEGHVSCTRLSEEQQNQHQSSTALFGSSEARTHHTEEATESRLQHMTRHLSAGDQRVHKQKRIWEEEDVGSSIRSSPRVAASGTAGESACPSPYTTVGSNARPNPQEPSQRQGTCVASPVSTWAPPAVLVHWIDHRLRQWAEEWKSVLADVQGALLLDATGDAQALHPTAHAAGEQEAHVGLGTSHEGASESTGGGEAVMTSSCRRDFACAIRTLLSFHSTELYKRMVAEYTRQAHDINEELLDFRSRLEALEVYAPHRYAVTARPPLLGVELEDVLVPRVGVRLRTVYHGYIADRAGLSVGDVLVGIGHQYIQTRAQLYVLMGELTRDYNAQCQIQIEEGFMRSFALGDGHCAKYDSPYRAQTVESDDHQFDQELQRARSEAAAAASGGTMSDDARSSGRWMCRHSSIQDSAAMADSSAAASPFLSQFHSAAQQKEKVAQYLPYFELCLHVVRDGRLRDVTLLIPPWEAFRSAAY